MALRFPLFIDLEKKKILLVGAGKVAVRRLHTLLKFGADVTVIADRVPEELKEEFFSLKEKGNVCLVCKSVEADDITREFVLVISAVSDREADAMVERRCRELEIPVNIASDRNRSDFYFPAVVCTKDQVIAVAGDGENHKKTARLAADLRAWVSDKGERI